jgi:hypothetical protein
LGGADQIGKVDGIDGSTVVRVHGLQLHAAQPSTSAALLLINCSRVVVASEVPLQKHNVV